MELSPKFWSAWLIRLLAKEKKIEHRQKSQKHLKLEVSELLTYRLAVPVVK